MVEAAARSDGTLLARARRLFDRYALGQSFVNTMLWLLDTIRLANTVNLILITIVMMLTILRRAEIAEETLATEYDRSGTLVRRR